MLTDALCTLVVFPCALGNNKSSALGVIAGEVSKKNTNNKNTMSVMELILNSALTLFRPLKFIIQAHLTCQESQRLWLPFGVPLYPFVLQGDYTPYRQQFQLSDRQR